MEPLTLSPVKGPCGRRLRISPTLDLFARFEANIVRSFNGCQLWTGGRDGVGYGTLRRPDNGRRVRVHRVMYALAHGEVPPDVNVCHTCDNRHCVRREHLWIGTNDDNMRDRSIKGRTRLKNGQPIARPHHISDADILAIVVDDRPHHIVAVDYGIARETVKNIKTGRTWRNITKGLTDHRGRGWRPRKTEAAR